MEKLKIFIGLVMLALLFMFNARHALSGYGVSNPNNELHPMVRAQMNSAGGGSATTPGTGSCNCGATFQNKEHSLWCIHWDLHCRSCGGILGGDTSSGGCTCGGGSSGGKTPCPTGGGMANQHCAIWHIDRIQTFPWPRIDCRTGGTHKCVDGVCPHGN